MTAGASAPTGNRLPWIIAILGLVIIALLLVQLALRLRAATELPVLGKAPEFTLTDQDGMRFSSSMLAGKVWVATFIYTTCPGPCPRVVERMAALDRRLARDPRVRLVSFSVDPANDTPEVLAAYARDRGIDSERWKLVTGDPDLVFRLIREGFKLAVNANPALEVPEAGPVVHSLHAVLVDNQGALRGFYDTSDPQAMSRLASDVGRLAGV